MHHDGVSAIQARDAQLIDHCIDRFVPEVLVGATQVDQVRRMNGDRAHAARAKSVAKLGKCLWLFLPAAPRGGVVCPDLDRRRADLLSPGGGLEQTYSERQVRPDLARFHECIVWAGGDLRTAGQFDGHQTEGVPFAHGP